MIVNIPDLTNGLFELLGGIFAIRNCNVIMEHKEVRGVSLLSNLFFTSWGFWNTYYYPHLDQWASFFGGVILAFANLAWLGLAVYYRRKNVR